MPHVENKFCLWSIDNKMWVHNINIYHKFDKNSWKPLTGQLTFTECLSVLMTLWPNVSITPNTAMGCRQCLPLRVVQLKGKHCRKPHCRNGVVDTVGHWSLTFDFFLIFQTKLWSSNSTKFLGMKSCLVLRLSQRLKQKFVLCVEV